MKIAFFDFDGTITNTDSLLKFIRFVVGDGKFLIGLATLSPILILYKLKVIPNYKAKQIMIAWFFKGCDENKFNKMSRGYSLNHIDKILREPAMKKINWHKSKEHKVVIVSASIESWLKPWCDKNNLELIATQLEIVDRKISGNFLSKNCHGIEKVNRIKESYNLGDFEYIYAYGDSRGDKEMLELADEIFYKPFRN